MQIDHSQWNHIVSRLFFGFIIMALSAKSLTRFLQLNALFMVYFPTSFFRRFYLHFQFPSNLQNSPLPFRTLLALLGNSRTPHLHPLHSATKTSFHSTSAFDSSFLPISHSTTLLRFRSFEWLKLSSFPPQKCCLSTTFQYPHPAFECNHMLWLISYQPESRNCNLGATLLFACWCWPTVTVSGGRFKDFNPHDKKFVF